MQPLAAFPDAALARVAGVFADIDDTLTTAGRLTAQAYGALEALQAAGLLVVPITGRPAGWCDMIARQWPVDAVVGENGAFYFRYDAKARKLQRRYRQGTAARQAGRARLDALRDEILRQVPGSGVASDQAYREADLAIDCCEDVAPLGPAAVAHILALAKAAGAEAKVSSIHVNIWFGAYDKLTMTRQLMAEGFGVDLDQARERYVFLGDSPNDQPMFAFFPHAVGVANVRAFEGQLTQRPAYVTDAAAGAGFAEFACRILDARREHCV